MRIRFFCTCSARPLIGRLHTGRSGLPAGRGGRHTHRLHRHGAESRRDSHRRHPCPSGRQLGGCAERGSPDGRHGEDVQRDATTADPTSATLTSTDPTTGPTTKTSPSQRGDPYTAGETTPPAVKVKANQSARKDFEGSDLIVADGQTVTYGSPIARFTHRTARVTIVLTDYTEGLASVQLTGLSTEGDNPDIIVPYDKGSNTYTAIVAPQNVGSWHYLYYLHLHQRQDLRL